VDHLPTIWESCTKKTEKFRTINFKHFFTALFKVNFKMFFLKYVEIGYSLKHSIIFCKKNDLRSQNTFDSVRANPVAHFNGVAPTVNWLFCMVNPNPDGYIKVHCLGLGPQVTPWRPRGKSEASA
jgi:hypothetical protein